MKYHSLLSYFQPLVMSWLCCPLGSYSWTGSRPSASPCCSSWPSLSAPWSKTKLSKLSRWFPHTTTAPPSPIKWMVNKCCLYEHWIYTSSTGLPDVSSFYFSEFSFSRIDSIFNTVIPSKVRRRRKVYQAQAVRSFNLIFIEERFEKIHLYRSGFHSFN